jgi:hypothetical protein
VPKTGFHGENRRKSRLTLPVPACGPAHGVCRYKKHILVQAPKTQSLVSQSSPEYIFTFVGLVVKKPRLKLIPEKEYFFTHKRKRTFRAVFKRIVRAPSTDTQDEFYYECEGDAVLSENPWADTHGGTRRTLLLRPSLITMIQDAPPIVPPTRRRMPLGQGKTLHLSEENWMKEWVHNIRSAFRNLRRS